MAKCPKCGRKLRLTQWRPECPACGVNMVYYDANERLIREAETAEVQHAKSQPGVDRAKAAFFGITDDVNSRPMTISSAARRFPLRMSVLLLIIQVVFYLFAPRLSTACRPAACKKGRRTWLCGSLSKLPGLSQVGPDDVGGDRRHSFGTEVISAVPGLVPGLLKDAQQLRQVLFHIG